MPILPKKTENRLPISTDETNNSVEAVIHNIMYDVIGYCAKNTR